MKKYFYAGIVIILLVSIALVGYGAYLNYSDENQITRRMEERVLHLAGAKATVRNLRATLNMDTIKLYSEEMADATALIDGRIVAWHVDKNAKVSKGSLLATLVNDQIALQIQQATSGVRKAEAVMAQAANSYHRQERLMAKNATSKEKYEESQAQYLAAQEGLNEAKAQREQYLVQNERQEVTAPLDGEVLIIYRREGSYVQGGTPLALVGNFEKLLFALTLPDEDAKYFQIGSTVSLKMPITSWAKAYDTEFAAGNKGIDEKITAVVREVSPPPSQSAGVRRLVCEIDNSSRLLEPLTYNGVIVESNISRQCLTVPLEAMVNSDHNAVFVVNSDKTIEKRKVDTGTDDGKNIEVYSGLKGGDVVIVGSFEGLKDGIKVDITLQED
ncbi:MAG: efflux RND transporter periplasmic adaptor subunit [Selenomonadaceae bacterium]|nr:efflux RND transporter periplasmic adaptor subunit [Selenomonadaceae bacterium]